jgi:hypothetical protein
LTRSQWQALAYLAQNEGIHQIGLAELLDVEPTTLSRNPFCWQLLFCLGAWAALGGHSRLASVIEARWIVYLGFAYLIFALVLTLAQPFQGLRDFIPQALYDAFHPNDKTNLAPYRVLHFVALALLVTRFLPKDWKGLRWPMFDPLIKCGQQSLRVFCVGAVLSFLVYFLLSISYGTLFAQMAVSLAGIGILCGIAYYSDWSEKADQLVKRSPLMDKAVSR